MPKKVLAALSGGVDSAISAYLLKKQGYTVEAVFMHNWDSRMEGAGAHCTLDADWQSVQRTCEVLGIEKVFRKNFQSSYWQRVFDPVIDGYASGTTTPNPDILCNREIKFGELFRWFETETDADFLATGHYARVFGGGLRQSVDLGKDQTYFLAAVEGDRWKRVLFPVGNFQKSVVKTDLVKEAGLKHLLGRKESMGICFVGKRKEFGSFVTQFLDNATTEGPIVHLDSSRLLKERHNGLAYYTVGQSARIGGAGKRLYVAGKDIENDTLYVVDDQNHPVLNKREISFTDQQLSGQIRDYLRRDVKVYCSIRSTDKMGVEIEEIASDGQTIRLKGTVYAPCPGQWAVLYVADEASLEHGRLCLGGAPICK